MAKIIGGLHGRPSGNVSGIVYGGARTRTGKVVTARELVIPANPRTGDQTLQRNKFMSSLSAVRGLGPQVYSEDFNRSIGQLPGFQSLMSILLNATDDDYELTVPPVTPLGDLHYPNTVNVVTGSSGTRSVQIQFSSENGSNGTPNDDTVALLIQANPDVNYGRAVTVEYAESERSIQGFIVLSLLPSTLYLVGLYFLGAGTALSLTSQCGWYLATSASST